MPFRPGLAFWLLCLILLLAGLAVGAYFYTRVDTITVVGNSAYTKEEIIAQSKLFTGKNILFYDLGAAKREIEKNPYLECVFIKRAFPKSIRIEVSERTEYAAVQALGGKFCIIDKTGYVLDVAREDPGELLPIYGLSSMSFSLNTRINDDRSKLRPYTVMEMLEALGFRMDEFEYIDISNTSSVRLKTLDGVTVVLGDSVDIPEKITRMFRALAKIDPERAEGAVVYVNSSGSTDLSYPTPVPTDTPEPSDTDLPDETPGGTELPDNTPSPGDTDAPEDTGSPEE